MFVEIVSRDYPKEIVTARSQLWPRYKAEKGKNPRAKVSIGFPAKLVINGRVVEDKFPDWFPVLRGSRHIQHTENTEVKGTHKIPENLLTKVPEVTQLDETNPNMGAQCESNASGKSKYTPGDQSETDEEDRDASMQMENDSSEATDSTQSGVASQYDAAMSVLGRLSQSVNPGAPTTDAPPVRDKSPQRVDPDTNDSSPK
ncbi:MAG: hypothetical protein N0E48_22285 [Candidatus Thiodiazotropha endolucinida]|nr:hypothetical protein [Candidatus Thiodiazotropha taylori]MCW4346064.1 hypothetical protein [Candidatus Thiodiazotropha endolucinida]